MSKQSYKNVLMVEEYLTAAGEERTSWTKVGVAFENRDGSFAIQLSAVPIGGGRLQMRDPWEEDRAPRGEREARETHGRRRTHRAA